jgi:hypothetical protein
VLIRAILEAAEAFEDQRLPELFCGFAASSGFPVPYEQANIPRAWAAAVPLLAAQLFLGLVPDAPHGRCFIAPWLPAWLPRLELRGVRVGKGKLDFVLFGTGEDTVVEVANAAGIDVIRATVEAPLAGSPMTSTGTKPQR